MIFAGIRVIAAGGVVDRSANHINLPAASRLHCNDFVIDGVSQKSALAEIEFLYACGIEGGVGGAVRFEPIDAHFPTVAVVGFENSGNDGFPIALNGDGLWDKALRCRDGGDPV